MVKDFHADNGTMTVSGEGVESSGSVFAEITVASHEVHLHRQNWINGSGILKRRTGPELHYWCPVNDRRGRADCVSFHALWMAERRASGREASFLCHDKKKMVVIASRPAQIGKMWYSATILMWSISGVPKLARPLPTKLFSKPYRILSVTW